MQQEGQANSSGSFAEFVKELLQDTIDYMGLPTDCSHIVFCDKGGKDGEDIIRVYFRHGGRFILLAVVQLDATENMITISDSNSQDSPARVVSLDCVSLEYLAKAILNGASNFKELCIRRVKTLRIPAKELEALLASIEKLFASTGNGNRAFGDFRDLGKPE
ncbi:MAG: hypothetical protein ACOX2O_06340 [Bdellovibrionota bacterium]|jgi:hypothetical protein